MIICADGVNNRVRMMSITVSDGDFTIRFDRQLEK